MKRAFISSLSCLLITVVIAGILGFLFSLAVPASASAPLDDAIPGSAADPLITQEWLEDYLQNSFAPLFNRLNKMEQKLADSVYIVLTIGEEQASINGKAVSIPAPPQILGAGYTMVPARFIGEALGLSVDWDAAGRCVTFRGQEQTVTLTIDHNIASINGQDYPMPMAPLIMGGYTLVHARFISEAFHCKVEWKPLNRQVVLFRY